MNIAGSRRRAGKQPCEVYVQVYVAKRWGAADPNKMGASLIFWRTPSPPKNSSNELILNYFSASFWLYTHNPPHIIFQLQTSMRMLGAEKIFPVMSQFPGLRKSKYLAGPRSLAGLATRPCLRSSELRNVRSSPRQFGLPHPTPTNPTTQTTITDPISTKRSTRPKPNRVSTNTIEPAE